MQVTLESLSERATVTDHVPGDWTVLTAYSDDVTRVDGTTVSFGPVDARSSDADPLTFEYFVEAPSGAQQTGRYTFGPATAVTSDDRTAAFGGTDTDTVIGPETNPYRSPATPFRGDRRHRRPGIDTDAGCQLPPTGRHGRFRDPDTPHPKLHDSGSVRVHSEVD